MCVGICICYDQRTNSRNRFLLFTMWILGMEKGHQVWRLCLLSCLLGDAWLPSIFRFVFVFIKILKDLFILLLYVYECLNVLLACVYVQVRCPLRSEEAIGIYRRM